MTVPLTDQERRGLIDLALENVVFAALVDNDAECCEKSYALALAHRKEP